jgi:hypothetical protein
MATPPGDHIPLGGIVFPATVDECQYDRPSHQDFSLTRSRWSFAARNQLDWAVISRILEAAN